MGLTSFIIKLKQYSLLSTVLSPDFSYSDTCTYFFIFTDMDDGLNGRSDSAFDESTMDTERDEDDGCGDEEEEVAQVSVGDGAASSVATANLCLPRPPLSHHTTALSAVKESALCDTSPLLLESSCGIVAAGSSSSSSTLPCSSSNSSCSSSVTRLEQLARLNNKTIICDMEDPKPGPSNSAADFDLEVI